MKVQVREQRGATVMSIQGSMVGGPEHYDRFHSKLRQALETETRNIILDLTECGYVASPGVGMIMTARASIHNRDCSLKLVVNTERVRHLFHLLHLFRILDIYGTLEEALESIGSQAEA